MVRLALDQAPQLPSAPDPWAPIPRSPPCPLAAETRPAEEAVDAGRLVGCRARRTVAAGACRTAEGRQPGGVRLGHVHGDCVTGRTAYGGSWFSWRAFQGSTGAYGHSGGDGVPVWRHYVLNGAAQPPFGGRTEGGCDDPGATRLPPHGTTVTRSRVGRGQTQRPPAPKPPTPPHVTIRSFQPPTPALHTPRSLLTPRLKGPKSASRVLRAFRRVPPSFPSTLL
jgi:hypothetical protein